MSERASHYRIYLPFIFFSAVTYTFAQNEAHEAGRYLYTCIGQFTGKREKDKDFLSMNVWAY